MLTMLHDAYVSVEIKDSALQALRDGLKRSLQDSGMRAEVASRDAHISIAYGEGDVALSQLEETVSEISCRPFMATVIGFEILHGLSTPYDYLVMQLSSEGAFENAIRAASDHMEVKGFGGEFHFHISLLRFPKNAVDLVTSLELTREMNASLNAAFALGCRPCLKGDCVSVYDSDRCRYIHVPIDS